MVTYPISIARTNYRGKDQNKKAKIDRENRIAADLENAINNIILKQEEPVHSYLYHDIASATGYPIETIRKLCFSIDRGHNGFDAIRPGLSHQEAMACIHDKEN